jgi:hypothetical protein
MADMRRGLLIVFAGCGHVPAAPPPTQHAALLEPHALAMPDESMVFRGRLAGVEVGSVRTAIGQPGWIDARHAIIVRSHARTEGFASVIGDIEWELSTTIDLDAGEPIDDVEEAWIDIAGDHEHHREQHTSGHDVHSAIALLRGWRSERGQRTELHVGIGGGHFDLDVWDAGHEVLASKPAVRYDGNVAGRVPMSLWLSDDAARVPLAFHADTELGAITIELADYDVGGD